MPISAKDILRRRHLAIMILRIFALVSAFLGVRTLATWLITGIFAGDLFDFAFYDWNMINAPLFLLAALICWLGDKRLARWIVPMSAPACPSCAYPIDLRRQRRCPECGYELAPEPADDGSVNR